MLMLMENSGMETNLCKLTINKYRLEIKLFFKLNLTCLLKGLYDIVPVIANDWVL